MAAEPKIVAKRPLAFLAHGLGAYEGPPLETEHEFHDLGDGRIEMEDKATYVLPFAPLGDLAHAWLVRPQLERIFAYREKAVRQLFDCSLSKG